MVRKNIAKYMQVISIVLLALLALTLVNLVLAYKTPEYKTQTINNYRVEHTVKISYNASVKPSLLYNNRSTIGNGEPLYTRLIKELDICFIYNVKSTPPALNNKYKASLKASLGSEGWSKVLDLDKTIYTDNQSRDFTACVNINFTKVLKYITVIEKEIGVRQDKHNVTIAMFTSIETLLPSRTLHATMTPTLILQINDDGRTYVITKNLRNTKDDSTILKSPTSINVMGFTMPTTSARVTLLPLAIVLGVATASSIGLVLRQETRKEKKLEDILRERLKGRLIKGTIDNANTVEISLNNIEDFIRIANEHRSDVIYDLTSKKYYIVDLNTLYTLSADNSQNEN